ncbi:MAG: hypothetical protein KJ666_05465 [Bacteroidetes bacterium]|nr:hypothetical protein [Bacteroidota bacterium]MBU2584636.1 hypothetical protein [Bacteroidota bacterium]
MTNKEYVINSIGVTFDWLKEIVKTPEMLEEIKNGSVIEFVQKDFAIPELRNQKKPQKYIKVKRHFHSL